MYYHARPRIEILAQKLRALPNILIKIRQEQIRNNHEYITQRCARRRRSHYNKSVKLPSAKRTARQRSKFAFAVNSISFWNRAIIGLQVLYL